MSQRFASDTMRSAFSRHSSAVTWQGTTVMARTSSSGEFNANIKASASSVPGSVTKMTFLDAQAGTASKATRMNTTMKSTEGAELNRENPEGEIFIVGRKIRRCSLASAFMSVKSNSGSADHLLRARKSGALYF